MASYAVIALRLILSSDPYSVQILLTSAGFWTEWGVSLTESLKPERAANRGLCGQNEPLVVIGTYSLCFL